LSQLEHFKRAFPRVPAEPEMIRLIERMAVPIIKNALIVKALELKSTYKTQSQDNEIT
jgi:hypothetical protein